MAIKDAQWIVMEHGTVAAAYDDSLDGVVISPNSDWFLYDMSIK